MIEKEPYLHSMAGRKFEDYGYKENCLRRTRTRNSTLR